MPAARRTRLSGPARLRTVPNSVGALPALRFVLSPKREERFLRDPPVRPKVWDGFPAWLFRG